MLFWHSQPVSYHQHSASGYLKEALTPLLKQKNDQSCDENSGKMPPFQYILCTATSPSVKLHDETLTYLNQGQSYEIRMINRKLVEYTDISSKYVKSVVRVVFHDRRLQYTEHQQLEGWRWSRPGDRILDIDVPLSVGILEPQAHPMQLNTVEFLWEPLKNACVFVQVNCISTEFTPRKHGGEKGVPFRIQIDTFMQNKNKEYTEHVHSASCQVKVFKPKGADRKLKTDRDRIEKMSFQEKEKYHPSYETTVLKECSSWPDPPCNSSPNSMPSPIYRSSAAPYSVIDRNSSPDQQEELPLSSCSDLLHPASSSQDTQQWLVRHGFSQFCRIFSSFTGADLLKMTKEDLMLICGTADGIRLFNTVKGRCVQPRLTVYVCEQKAKSGGEDAVLGDVYHALYLDDLTVVELTEKIAHFCNMPPMQINQVYKQAPSGIHVLVSDKMVQNFTEETCFTINIVNDENNVCSIVLK